jgi:hypothetical protein
MWHEWRRGEVCTGFWWGNLRERGHWGDPGVDGRITLRWIFRKWERFVDRERWRALVSREIGRAHV